MQTATERRQLSQQASRPSTSGHPRTNQFARQIDSSYSGEPTFALKESEGSNNMQAGLDDHEIGRILAAFPEEDIQVGSR